jgi:3-deoxy-7-phosphoheptulonate synthase
MTSTLTLPLADYHLFPSPAQIIAEMPLPAEAAAMVARSRAGVRAVLDRADDRLLVVAGPCSVHDPAAALDYAARLADIGLADDLVIVMRAYPERVQLLSSEGSAQAPSVYCPCLMPG